MEGASAGSLEGTGNRTFNRDQVLPSGLTQARHSPQKVHCVRMLGVVKYLANWAILHYLTKVHYGDRVSDLRDHTQIVSNKHDSHAQAFL